MLLLPYLGGLWTIQDLNSEMQSLIPPSDWHLDLANGQSKPMLFENKLVAKGQLH